MGRLGKDIGGLRAGLQLNRVVRSVTCMGLLTEAVLGELGELDSK